MAAIGAETTCEVCGTYVLRADRWQRCGYCAGVLCPEHAAGECAECQRRHAVLRGRGGVLTGHAVCTG